MTPFAVLRDLGKMSAWEHLDENSNLPLIRRGSADPVMSVRDWVLKDRRHAQDPLGKESVRHRALYRQKEALRGGMQLRCQ